MASEKIKSQEVENTWDSSITIKIGEGISNISEAFHIKWSYLASLPNLGTIREWDKFSIHIDANGNIVLNKYRKEPLQTVINENYIIPKDQIVKSIDSVKRSPKSVVRDILSADEKKGIEDIYSQVHISPKSIEYKGNSITLNIAEGMEWEVKLLISQLIVRGMYDHKKANILLKTKNEAFGNKYYENDQWNIDAKDWFILDTTIVSEALLLKLFKFKPKQSPNQLEWEKAVVAEILVNFVNGILKQEIK